MYKLITEIKELIKVILYICVVILILILVFFFISYLPL